MNDMNDSNSQNNDEEICEIQPKKTVTTNIKRKNLTTGERLRIINDFKRGIPDKYYSVNPNPRKPGEFILRKRKKPIEYEIDEYEIEGLTTMSSKGDDENTLIDSTPSKTPSQLLTEPKKSMVGGGAVLNTLAGTEFFSMQSTLNANLQRELDALHEKFNKLDIKFRKERAKRKAQKQTPRPGNSTVQKRRIEKEPQNEDAHEYEYEYEYADEPISEQVQVQNTRPSYPRRPIIDIRNF